MAMYLKENCWLLLCLCCGLGVMSRPMDAGVCDSQGARGLQGEYSAVEEEGGAQEAECADPKAQDKPERKDAGEEAERKEGKFEESRLAEDSGDDKRESRYQLDDLPSCESQGTFYEDQDVAKYRDAFGGFPQDSGRGKRVKRNFFYH